MHIYSPSTHFYTHRDSNGYLGAHDLAIVYRSLGENLEDDLVHPPLPNPLSSWESVWTSLALHLGLFICIYICNMYAYTYTCTLLFLILNPIVHLPPPPPSAYIYIAQLHIYVHIHFRKESWYCRRETYQHAQQSHNARHCNTQQHTATHCNTLQRAAMHCSRVDTGAARPRDIQKSHALHHTAPHCTTRHHTATHCSTLQQPSAHCSTLQHTASHCITLQHRSTHTVRKYTISGMCACLCKRILFYRALLQNIVSFTGLFCKRDLNFFGMTYLYVIQNYANICTTRNLSLLHRACMYPMNHTYKYLCRSKSTSDEQRSDRHRDRNRFVCVFASCVIMHGGMTNMNFHGSCVVISNCKSNAFECLIIYYHSRHMIWCQGLHAKLFALSK